MAAVAAAHGRFTIALEQAQYWPGAKVLVAKIVASDQLKALLKQVETSMQDCGFVKERTQTAHVTLAYLPRGAQPQAQPAIEFAATPLRIDRIHLLRTEPGGYMSLATWPLAGASTDA